MLEIEIKPEFVFDTNSVAPVTKTFLQKRCEFFQRYQNQDETIYTYLEDIRNLAECCNFYKNEEKLLIRDRLVSGLNNINLQLKIIETHENPTIEDVINICEGSYNYSHFEELETEDNNDIIALNIFERDNNDEKSGNDVDDIDEDVSDEPNCEPDNFKEIEDTSSIQYGKNSDKRAIDEQFKKNGWAYPTCSACGKTFEYLNYLKVHLLEHAVNKHSNKIDLSKQHTSCVLCNKTFGSKQVQLSHYANHTSSKLDIPKVNCGVCRKLTTIFYLENHMMNQHVDEKQYSCPVCNKKFKSKHSFSGHTVLHKQHKTCTCDICGKQFKRQIYLNVHKQKQHPVLDAKIDILECYVCKKEYKSMVKLRTHINLHFAAKNHLCTQCGHQFRDAFSLAKHLLRADHGGVDNRKFQCETCGKKFTERTRYINHRYIHTDGDRPFKCTYENCNKSYMYSHGLKQHYRKHIGEYPFRCNQCNFKSVSSSHLKTHKLVHQGLPTRFYRKNYGKK